MTGISNRISLTYRSVIEEIFKFRVDMVQEIFTSFLSVNNHRKKKTMYAYNNWLAVYLLHRKTGGFLSLQITFAQGHIWAHMQVLKCSAGFWTSKRSQHHIVIHISSLQGCSVYFYFFCIFFGILFSFGRTLSQGFSKADEAARWSLQSFCEACVSPRPSAFSEGLLPGETASGSPLPRWAARSETLQPPSISIS